MFTVEVRPDATMIRVTDHIDISSADRLWSEIAARHVPVVVSLEGCPYCDSTALSIFVRAAKRFAGLFALIVPPDSRCEWQFDLTGLTWALPVYASVALVRQFSPDGKKSA
jgi:anti-anti-sigma factor